MNMHAKPELLAPRSTQSIEGIDYTLCTNCGKTVQNKVPMVGKNGFRWTCSCGWGQNVWSCKVA